MGMSIVFGDEDPSRNLALEGCNCPNCRYNRPNGFSLPRDAPRLGRAVIIDSIEMSRRTRRDESVQVEVHDLDDRMPTLTVQFGRGHHAGVSIYVGTKVPLNRLSKICDTVSRVVTRDFGRRAIHLGGEYSFNSYRELVG